MASKPTQLLLEKDAAVRMRDLKPRAIAEEAKFGISDERPLRHDGVSDSYWFIRQLTYDIVGMSYRVPQMNMYLLEDYINERTFGKYRIKHCIYVAPGEKNLRFTTDSGRVDFFARERIDPKEFLAKFGLL